MTYDLAFYNICIYINTLDVELNICNWNNQRTTKETTNKLNSQDWYNLPSVDVNCLISTADKGTSLLVPVLVVVSGYWFSSSVSECTSPPGADREPEITACPGVTLCVLFHQTTNQFTVYKTKRLRSETLH